ncbi:MAG TPA: glycosyltransferase family 4 protein [Vicinamibacterales bacterium]|nr:glycosyltransferase family 4 protein [Vicinamibacterales bacterium]
MTGSQRREIGFLCHPYHRGGVTRWMVDAAIACADQGARVYFVAPEPEKEFVASGGRPTVASLLRETRCSGDLHLRCPKVDWKFELGTVAFRAAFYSEALRLSVPENVPVVLSDDSAAWAGAASVCHRNPMIGVLHADSTIYYRLAHEYVDMLAAAVCVSTRIANCLREQLAKPPLPIVRIPCGIPLRSWTPHPRTQPRGRLRLIFVGRIEERQKRVSDLVRIVTLLREKREDILLDVLGDGEDRAAMEVAVRDAGLSNCVLFHGWLSTEAVAERLGAADVLILPSNFEGMPIAVMEALAAGCSVVASRVSGLEDYESDVDGREVLRLFSIADCNAAVEQILGIADSPFEFRCGHARSLADREFSIERCAKRYLSLCASLAETARVDAGIAKQNGQIPIVQHIASIVLAALRYGAVKVRKSSAAL